LSWVRVGNLGITCDSSVSTMCCFVVCNLCYEGSLVAASFICLDVLCFLLMKYVLQCTFEKKKFFFLRAARK